MIFNMVGGSGGRVSSISKSDVNFYDYDGTILHSYTANEALALAALPPNPSHDGLTAQGWNYTLAQIQTEINDHGTCDIGQMYITDDGKTRVYIRLVDSARLSPYLGICPDGTVVVDWGDGSATDTLTGTSLTIVQRVQHTYASAGDYVISLTVSSGTFAIYGGSTSSNGSYLLTRTDGNIISQRCYQNAIQKIELGASVDIGERAFESCYSLESLTIPSIVTSIGNYAFRYCYSLESLTIPSSVTSINGYAFQNCCSLASITIPSSVTSISGAIFSNCYSIESLTIPSSVTSIGGYAFQACYSFASITIPSSVTSIGAYAFQNCYGVAEYHMLPTTPPTLSNTNAFTSILSDCIIYVPTASLSAYQTATNWSTYASYMIGE